MSNAILITGARSAVALDLSRDFHRLGYTIHTADCSSAYISKYSKSSDFVHSYASPVHNAKQFIADITALVKEINPLIIIPTCEEIFHLSRPNLSSVVKDRIFSPSLNDLHILHAKDQFIIFCNQIGIRTPETHVIRSCNDLSAFFDHSLEWVFKPCYSRFGAKTIIAPTSKVLNSILPTPQDSWLAQKYIKGQELSFYAIAHTGKLAALSVYSSKWRLKGGASYVFETSSNEIFNKVKIIAKTIAASLNLTSQFACDMMMDQEGKIWVIECNPRSTSGIHLLTGTGRLAQAMLNQNEEVLYTQNTKRYMLPMMLTYGLITTAKESRWSEWLNTIKSGDDVISTSKEYLPILGSILDTVIFMKHVIKHKMSLQQATTFNIEWNGENLQ